MSDTKWYCTNCDTWLSSSDLDNHDCSHSNDKEPRLTRYSPKNRAPYGMLYGCGAVKLSEMLSS